MSELASEVVVGTSGKVWVAATSATAPNDASTAMDSTEWTELGFVSEAGATFTDSRTMADILAWQAFGPIRRTVTARDQTLAFVLRQWNGATIPFAFGGGSITGSTGDWTYTPPDASTVDERSLVLEWADGDKAYRIYFPRGMVSDAVSTNLVRSGPADLPITFGVITDGITDPYLLFSNDDALAHASGS
jgi:hypothetical protein